MNKTKLSLAAGLFVVVAGMMSSEARAQVVVLGPPIPGPRVVARAVVPAPVRVYRPMVAAPVVSPYRAGYGVYPPAPRYIAPVYPAPVVVTRVRPAVIGPGIGGYPNVYIPGQPIRNAIRYVVP